MSTCLIAIQQVTDPAKKVSKTAQAYDMTIHIMVVPLRLDNHNVKQKLVTQQQCTEYKRTCAILPAVTKTAPQKDVEKG